MCETPILSRPVGIDGMQMGVLAPFYPLWLLNGWRYYKEEEEEDGVVLSESSISDVTRD